MVPILSEGRQFGAETPKYVRPRLATMAAAAAARALALAGASGPRGMRDRVELDACTYVRDAGWHQTYQTRELYDPSKIAKRSTVPHYSVIRENWPGWGEAEGCSAPTPRTFRVPTSEGEACTL